MPMPTMTTLVETSERNFIPTVLAAAAPVARACSRVAAFKALCLLFKILVVDTQGDSLSMSEAIAIHNLFPLFAPPKSAAKLVAR